MFGLLTIQLKPQLEKLLKLPADSLTKEIELTQDLLKLFIDSQIPSDLLSFDGDQEAEVKVKIDSVKDHVKSIMDILDKTKKDQLEETTAEFIQKSWRRSQFQPGQSLSQRKRKKSVKGVKMIWF